MELSAAYLVILLAIVVVFSIIGLLTRYKKCKPDELMVVFGKTRKKNRTSKIIQGGAAFIWPVIQGYEFMSLRPLQIDCTLKGAISKQKIRVDIPAKLTVAISTEPDIQQNAAERMLGLHDEDKIGLINDIVYGQLRLIIAEMTIEQLNADREEFLRSARENIDVELKKLGLILLNINMEDIRDEADYIVNLAKKEESKAKNQALAEISEQEKLGATQIAIQVKEKETAVAETKKNQDVLIANTLKEREIQLAEAERDQNIGIAEAERDRDSKVAEAQSIKDIAVAQFKKNAQVGQNSAAEEIANSDAKLKITMAAAERESEAAKAEALAEIDRRKEIALKAAKEAEAEKNEADLKATIIVPAEMSKREIEISAEAQRQKAILIAEGEAQAIRMRAEAEAAAIRAKALAEAEGKQASLMADANGFKAMLDASESHPEIAVQYWLKDKWESIVAEGSKAFENIKMGEITVYDKGGNTTKTFIDSIVSVVPGLNILKSIPGMPDKIANFLASEADKNKDQHKDEEEKEPEKS